MHRTLCRAVYVYVLPYAAQCYTETATEAWHRQERQNKVKNHCTTTQTAVHRHHWQIKHDLIPASGIRCKWHQNCRNPTQKQSCTRHALHRYPLTAANEVHGTPLPGGPGRHKDLGSRLVNDMASLDPRGGKLGGGRGVVGRRGERRQEAGGGGGTDLGRHGPLQHEWAKRVRPVSRWREGRDAGAEAFTRTAPRRGR